MTVVVAVGVWTVVVVAAVAVVFGLLTVVVVVGSAVVGFGVGLVLEWLVAWIGLTERVVVRLLRPSAEEPSCEWWASG